MKNNRYIIVLFFVTGLIWLLSCKRDTEDMIENAEYELEYGNLPIPELPSDNPLTEQGVKLGRMLFYEKALSLDNSISCASCHQQSNAFSDTSRFSIGVQGLPGKRQAMGVFNMAWNSNEFFWDGRSHLLRDQALRPIQDPLEMHETLDNVVQKLKSNPVYRAQFRHAFGSEEINSDRIALALEQFMNSIVSYQSKYDQWQDGKVILSAEEERGRFLFFTEFNPAFPLQSGADCVHCHSGANFENDKYMNNGLDHADQQTDAGRQMVSGLLSDKARFKVPSLRNVALTFPYMHDGRFRTLEEVVDHYNLVKVSPTLDASFYQQLPAGLRLTSSDRAALVAFLKTLTDETLIANPQFSDPFK